MDRWPKWLVHGVIIFVALLWGASIVLNMWDDSYAIPSQLHLAMSAILAALIGNEYFFKNGKPKE